MTTPTHRRVADAMGRIDVHCAGIRAELRLVAAERPDLEEQIGALLACFEQPLLPDAATKRRAGKETGEVLTWRITWRKTPKGKLQSFVCSSMTKREARTGWYRTYKLLQRDCHEWQIEEAK